MQKSDHSQLIESSIYSTVNAISFVSAGILTWLIWKMPYLNSSVYFRIVLYMAIFQLLFDMTGFIFSYVSTVVFYEPKYAWLDLIRVFCCDTSLYLSCILLYYTYYLIKNREILTFSRWSKPWWVSIVLMIVPQTVYFILIIIGVYSKPNSTSNYYHNIARIGFYYQTYLRVLYCTTNVVLYFMSEALLRERRLESIACGQLEMTRQEIASRVVLRRMGYYPIIQVLGNVFYMIYLYKYDYTFHYSVSYEDQPTRYALQLLANVMLVSVTIGDCAVFLYLQPGAWDFLKNSLMTCSSYFMGRELMEAPESDRNSDIYLTSAFDEYRCSTVREPDGDSYNSGIESLIKNEDIHLCRDEIVYGIIQGETRSSNMNPMSGTPKRRATDGSKQKLGAESQVSGSGTNSIRRITGLNDSGVNISNLSIEMQKSVAGNAKDTIV